MNLAALDPGLLAWPFVIGLLVLATHVPLGRRVLARGIIFLDLAVAQLAVLGVVAAHALDLAADGWPTQLAAATTALLGAALLAGCEQRWPQIQEALIGSTFVVAASLAVLLLAGDPHGGEHLAELLTGQVLWATPEQALRIGALYGARLAEVDPANAAAHRARGQAFAARWRAAIARWETRAAPLKNLPVAVQHKSFSYLLAWLGLREVAVLEPRPGVEPSVSHLARVAAQLQATPAQMVLRAAYQSPRPADWLASRTGIPALALPYTVGGNDRAQDLFGLFDDTLDQLLKAAH
jgi:ABC-type Zn uptake system ZnuABC Zn-binding protein ZnuA